MLKVAFDFGVNPKGDEIRGIGVHISQLLRQFKKDQTLNDKFQIVENSKKADILHITKFNPYHISLPFFKPTKKVVLTIHDLIPLIYPKHYPPGLKGQIKFLINKLLICKNVDAIITISETSKKDICRFLKIDPCKVYVVYLAPRKEFKKINDKKLFEEIKNKYNLPQKFALYTGDVNYNKNIPLLVEGCKKADIPLIIVGKQAASIEKENLNHPELIHLKEINWGNTIRLGYVSTDDLVIITNMAMVYIQPSLYEGFGLPVLEALACKTPVIAAKTQALVEIAGDDCIFFNPKDVKDLVYKIINYDNKEVKISGDYSWEKTAQKTFEIYEKI